MDKQKRFHLVFSLVMGLLMISLMTCVITAVNLGFPADFLDKWLHAFGVAYVIGVPVIFFVAPLARKLTGRLVGMQ